MGYIKVTKWPGDANWAFMDKEGVVSFLESPQAPSIGPYGISVYGKQYPGDEGEYEIVGKLEWWDSITAREPSQQSHVRVTLQMEFEVIINHYNEQSKRREVLSEAWSNIHSTDLYDHLTIETISTNPLEMGQEE